MVLNLRRCVLAKEYITYMSNLKELELGKAKTLMIRDLTPGLYKYEARYVKGLIYQEKPARKKVDRLWIRHGSSSALVKEPFYLVISEEMGDLKKLESLTKYEE